jgi:hypothetical protein
MGVPSSSPCPSLCLCFTGFVPGFRLCNLRCILYSPSLNDWQSSYIFFKKSSSRILGQFENSHYICWNGLGDRFYQDIIPSRHVFFTPEHLFTNLYFVDLNFSLLILPSGVGSPKYFSSTVVLPTSKITFTLSCFCRVHPGRTT